MMFRLGVSSSLCRRDAAAATGAVRGESTVLAVHDWARVGGVASRDDEWGRSDIALRRRVTALDSELCDRGSRGGGNLEELAVDVYETIGCMGDRSFT